MLITVSIYVAVICISTASSEPISLHRSKRSDDFVRCERGWYYFSGNCYKVFAHKTTERLSWSRALERCRSYGGDLVSIQSQEEQDFIVSFLQLAVKSSVWIGLNDQDKEGDYKWTYGSVFNYTNWKQGEPSGKGSGGEEEDCVHIVFEPEADIIGKWNDRNCDTPETYICEMESNRRKRSPNQMFCSSEEGKGWKFQSSCYHVVKEEKSWQDAEKHCRNYFNGHLVDILDTLEDFFLDYIASTLNTELWIGIKTKDQLLQKWSSGFYVSYDGFDKDPFNILQHFGEGLCVARRERKDWITIPCADKLSFICETSSVSPPVLKPAPKGSHCPLEWDEWRDLGGEYCYYFEKEKQLSFYEALFDCKRRGGSLVSLHSKEESDMLLPFVKYVRKFFYIGLFRLYGREEEFAWTDGSPLDYENWKVNEPNSLDEKCVEALTHDDPNGVMFTWNDISCGDKRGYICSVKKIVPDLTLEEEDSCTSNISYKVWIVVSVCIILLMAMIWLVIYYYRHRRDIHIFDNSVETIKTPHYSLPINHPQYKNNKNNAAATTTAQPLPMSTSEDPCPDPPPQYRSKNELIVEEENKNLHYNLMSSIVCCSKTFFSA